MFEANKYFDIYQRRVLSVPVFLVSVNMGCTASFVGRCRMWKLVLVVINEAWKLTLTVIVIVRN